MPRTDRQFAAVLPFSQFAVSRTYQANDALRAQVVSGVLEGREVQVHYVEPSGEFLLVEAGKRRALSDAELRDLAGVMQRFQQFMPWVDGAAGSIMLGLNDAIYPSVFSTFRVRSVSELGHLLLLAGRGLRGDVDVVLDTATHRLTVLETVTGHAAVKRPMTVRERADLQVVLERCVARRLQERTQRLLMDVLDAVRTH